MSQAPGPQRVRVGAAGRGGAAAVGPGPISMGMPIGTVPMGGICGGGGAAATCTWKVPPTGTPCGIGALKSRPSGVLTWSVCPGAMPGGTCTAIICVAIVSERGCWYTRSRSSSLLYVVRKREQGRDETALFAAGGRYST